MKFYRLFMIIPCLWYSLQVQAFWPKWVDTITAKITNTTDVIIHKEFAKVGRLEITNQHGAIIINSWQQNSIAIEIITTCVATYHKDIKIDIEQIDDVIKIHTIFLDEKIKGSVVFNILLPQKTDVNLNTKSGDIIIKEIHGTLDLLTGEGNIKLINPHQSLQATTDNGSIIIRTDTFTPTAQCTLISTKGDIQLYTTPTLNSSINASAPQGKIISDIPITLESITTLLNNEAWKHFKQNVHGAIGNPLADIKMYAHNGSISIMPYLQQTDIF